jgi:hypothetical protein
VWPLLRRRSGVGLRCRVSTHLLGTREVAAAPARASMYLLGRPCDATVEVLGRLATAEYTVVECCGGHRCANMEKRPCEEFWALRSVIRWLDHAN